MHEPPPKRPSIVESPWYWLYLFCTAGLIALVVMGPRYQARQAQIERNFEGRERANQRAAGESVDETLPSETGTRIGLRPLYLTLAGLLLIAWGSLWWQHFRRRDPLPADRNHVAADRESDL